MEFTTKDGRPITFEYLEQDPKDKCGREKGFIVHRVNALVDGVEAGYLKISYIPSWILEECFPTIWHWYRTQGCCFDADDLLSTWFNVHWSVGCIPLSLKGKVPAYLQITRDMAPDEDTMRADLAHLETIEARWGGTWRLIGDWYEEHKRGFVDRPFVDFIRVYQGNAAGWYQEGPTETDWRRQGIGSALYLAGAQWLAETKGLPLHASGCQSDSAAATWRSLRKNKNLPIRLRKRPWDHKRVLVLDYTGARYGRTG